MEDKQIKTNLIIAYKNYIFPLKIFAVIKVNIDILIYTFITYIYIYVYIL